jgi:peroxiredoxin
MKKSVLCFGILSLCFALLSFALNPLPQIDKTIKNFKLKSTENKMISLSDYKNAKGFIIVFTCNKCPMAKLYSERLNLMSLKFRTQGVYLLAVNSMDTVAYKEESFKLMQKKVLKEKTTFPYLQDKKQVVAKQFKAINTPQAFVIWKNKSGKWVQKYEGVIDDSALEPKKGNNYLEKAVDELLQNKPVSNPITESVGCRIFYRGVFDKMR